MVIMITYVGMWITTCFFRIPPWDNGCNGALNQKTLANKIQIKCLDNFEMWMASHVLAKNMPHVELGYVERRRRERWRGYGCSWIRGYLGAAVAKKKWVIGGGGAALTNEMVVVVVWIGNDCSHLVRVISSSSSGWCGSGGGGDWCGGSKAASSNYITMIIVVIVCCVIVVGGWWRRFYDERQHVVERLNNADRVVDAARCIGCGSRRQRRSRRWCHHIGWWYDHRNMVVLALLTSTNAVCMVTTNGHTLVDNLDLIACNNEYNIVCVTK